MRCYADPTEVCFHVEVQLALHLCSWSHTSCFGAVGALPLRSQTEGSWRNFFPVSQILAAEAISTEFKLL